jgi:hypothetical protein
MEREENGILVLFEKLAGKIIRFEKQIKTNNKLSTSDMYYMFEISDYIDKIQLHVKNKTWDKERAAKVYGFLISKDVELVSLAKVILDHA